MTDKKFIIFLFIIALLSGFFWNQKVFSQPIGSDQVLYDSVAQNILSGKGFVYEGRDVIIEPLYPLFLSGVYGVFGHNYDVVRIIQIIIFSLIVILVYLLAKKLFGHKIAICSGLVIALFYGLANQAGGILTEPLFIFLISSFILVIYKASSGENDIWLFVSGIFLGLASLTRGIAEFFFVLVLINIFILYFRKIPGGKIIFKMTLFMAGFLIILLPWILGNNSVKTSPMVASRSGGILLARTELMENLYQNYPANFIGHLFGYYFSQKIYPDIKSSVFRETPKTDKKVSDLLKSGKNSYEIDKMLTKEAEMKILTSPHKYILMSALDFISFNSPIIPNGSLWQNTLTIHPMFAEGRHSEIPELVKAVIIFSLRFIWFSFLFFVIYGLVKNFKKWDKISWIFLIITYFNFAYSAIHAIPRYALPIYPFYIILATVGLFAFIKKYENLLSNR